MVRKCKRFLMLALTALLVCNEIIVVEASGSEQVSVVEGVQQENATEVTSLTNQEEDLEETGEGEENEEVTTEANMEDEAEVETETETEEETETETKEETETETEEKTEELTTEELTEIEDDGIALAMSIEQGENFVTYAVADLEQVNVDGAESKVNDDGSVHFTFPKQYSQLCVRIPKDIEKARLAKIVCNTKDDISKLSLKILRTEEFSKESEAAVAYEVSQIEVSDALSVDDMEYVGIMGLVAGYEVTIDSITFEYAEENGKEQNTQNGYEFTFDQLEVVANHSLTKEVTEDGALKVSYEKQWGEVRFEVPESIDVTKLNKLMVKVKSGDIKNLSLKLLSDYSFDTQDNLLVAAYEASELCTDGVVDKREDIKCFGIMSKAEDVAEFEFESVVFEMDAGIEEAVSGIQREVPDLKDAIAAKTDSEFITGVSITNGEITDKDLMDLVTKHFNAVTLGNELKPDCLFGYSNDTCPGTETITFKGVEMEVPTMDYSRPEKMLDAILEWNENNPDDFIQVRGHVLVWHSQTPEWFFCKDYDTKNGYVDKGTMTLRQEWYIKTVLEHFTGEDSKYKELFYGWDVVNEAVSDGSGTYRHGDENSTWWKVYGNNDFIIDAFRFANQYAPADVELYYNDYNEWVTSKVGGIVQLLKDVKNADGTRIDGMGMQGHYATDASPSIDQIKDAARAYAEVVDKIQITELDLKASNAYDGTSATEDAEYTKQAYRYKNIYDAILELRAEGVNLSNMTIWGVIDKNSWLQTSNSVGGASDGSRKQCPLLFDDNYQVKPAYWAFVDITKLKPEIKSFDISQVVDDAFTATTSLEMNSGSAQMTAIPVWDEDGIHVFAKVKDATVDATDAVTVYVSANGKITKEEVVRKEGTATADGYEVVIDIACDKSMLSVPTEILMDMVLTDGATKNAYNDYTMKQETSNQYYAKASLKPYIMIPKGTVTVDGTRETAWDHAVDVPLTINLGSKVKANAELVWDEENLYVYMDVTDSVLNSASANAHEKDSIEIFIDENNHKSSAYEEDDKQYRINYLDEHSFNGTKCLEENMQSVVTLTDKGYTVEVALAWTDAAPTADMKIGLELQINDADVTGKRIGTLSWYDTSGNGWSEPGVFGTAILTNAIDNNDALEKPEEKPDTPAKPNKGNQTSSTSSNNRSTTRVVKTSQMHTIIDNNVPLVSGILEENENFVSIAFSEKKALLSHSLLSKYYGKVDTLMVHLGNGIGYTIDANAIVGNDVDLSATLQCVRQFAEGFDTFEMNTSQSIVLNGEMGIHVNVGAQYTGLQAYIFQKNIMTGLYELKNMMPVNEVGNVVVMTNAVADMYIMIEK